MQLIAANGDVEIKPKGTKDKSELSSEAKRSWEVEFIEHGKVIP